MKRKPTWWKLYLFVALTGVVFFLLPPANHTALMLWTLLMFGGIAIWLQFNQAGLTETSAYRYIVVSPPVAEFFDEDRVHIQQYATEASNDNVISSPHEAA
ncbi:MAG: hypothetical protein GC179_26885 [Anaerolineaceae bacterium]|nr:hypothetical protein [Anaerolineaceae bacterium]